MTTVSSLSRSVLLFTFFAAAGLIWQGCGGGGGDSSTPAGPDASGGGSLTAAEQNAVSQTIDSVWQALVQQGIASFTQAAAGPSQEIHGGAWQGSTPCPGGGSVSGGGSGTYNDETGAVRGQGSASSNSCISADGMVNITGTVSAQLSGTCPGSVSATVTGNVTVSRKGQVGWIPVENAFGILQTVSVGC
jgi:hypothetical protein